MKLYDFPSFYYSPRGPPWEKHVGEKSAYCPLCGKKFTPKDNMQQHERTHKPGGGRSKSRTSSAFEPGTGNSEGNGGIERVWTMSSSTLASMGTGVGRQLWTRWREGTVGKAKARR